MTKKLLDGLKYTASFFAMFFVVLIFNRQFQLVVQNARLVAVDLFSILENGFCFVLKNAAETFLSVAYEQIFGIVLSVVAFVCLNLYFVCSAKVLCTVCGVYNNVGRSGDKSVEQPRGTVSYRFKVCFLS